MVYTREETYLVYINDVDKYLNMVLRQEVKEEDYVNFDKDPVLGNHEGLVCCNQMMNDASVRPTVEVASATGVSNFREPIYAKAVTPVMNGNPVTGSTFRYRINLNMFKNTLFEVDKDIYFKEVTYIRFVFNGSPIFIGHLQV